MAANSVAANLHSEEEALDSLLEEAERQPADGTGRRSKVLFGLAAASAVIAVAWWGSTAGVAYQGHAATRQSSSRLEEKYETAVHPRLAHQRTKGRERLKLEEDLESVLHKHVSQGTAHFTAQIEMGGPEECLKHAKSLFQEFMSASGLVDELYEKELDSYKQRFTSAMQSNCKSITGEAAWLKAAGKELEQQKPLMTQALATSLNRAGLGFQTKMQDWLLEESVESFQGRLGLLPIPEDQKSVLQRTARRKSTDLPETFRAQQKWPKCKESILRIHNQGHCGSCWAFGSLASLDARMCIASQGRWDAPTSILSRLHAASCANPGHDGCQGGWMHWPMQMMAQRGLVSESCLPYYISGEGIEHFEKQDTAPPCDSCELHCQGGYSVDMSSDRFWSAGVQNYDWIRNVHGNPEKIMAMKTAIYDEGPITFAFFANSAFMGYSGGVFSVCTGQDSANHAVYAYGWGVLPDATGGPPVDFIEASNSWGTHWGVSGHFRIHPRCITDVTIAGTIEATVVNHSIGVVDPDVLRDPDNEFWPWEKPNECPFKDGCITDMEGSADYANSEECVSQQLNKKRISVVQFETEWGYDILKVNGHSFSGKEGRGLNIAALNGSIVDDNGITFTSDFSNVGPGFKICAV